MKQFGKMMGVSESAISLYENNKAQPDINMMCKMADYFGVSIDFLLGYKTEETKEETTEETPVFTLNNNALKLKKEKKTKKSKSKNKK